MPLVTNPPRLLNDPRAWVALILLALLPVAVGGTGTAREELYPAELAACLEGARSHAPEWVQSLEGRIAHLGALMLVGRCRLEAGDGAGAVAAFRDGLRTDPEHAVAWRVNLLRGLIAAGERAEAEAQVRRLAESPVPGMREALRDAIAGALERTPPPPGAARELLAAYFAAVPPERLDAPLARRLWELARDDPATDEAREAAHLAALALWQLPADQDSATEWADAVEAGVSAGRTGPTPDMRVRRARELRRHRLVSRIREELAPETLPEVPPDAARALGAVYFWAMGRARAYTLGVRTLDRPEVQAAFHLERESVLRLRIDLLLQARDVRDAAANLAELEELAPDSASLAVFFLSLARAALHAGRPDAMERWAMHAVEHHGEHYLAAEAYWLVAWHHYRGGDLNGAAALLERFLATGQHTAYRPRFLYWLGRIRGLQDDAAAAREAWGELVAEHPDDFYALLARGDAVHRLGEPAAVAAEDHADGVGRPHLDTLAASPELGRVLGLFLLDEPRLGEAALDAALEHEQSPHALLELARAMAHLGHYHLMYGMAARYVRASQHGEVPPDPVAERMAYPLAFWDVVADGASDRGPDPLFVLAVMREESHFRADADSAAGAKGLMQLMPTTAEALARDHDVPLPGGALFRPEVNIRLGQLYLERLYRRFDGNAVHVAAGYNAGPTAVRRWLRRMDGVPADEFVERIPYTETQRYVRKVLASSAAYRRLYAAQ